MSEVIHMNADEIEIRGDMVFKRADLPVFEVGEQKRSPTETGADFPIRFLGFYRRVPVGFQLRQLTSPLIHLEGLCSPEPDTPMPKVRFEVGEVFTVNGSNFKGSFKIVALRNDRLAEVVSCGPYLLAESLVPEAHKAIGNRIEVAPPMGISIGEHGAKLRLPPEGTIAVTPPRTPIVTQAKYFYRYAVDGFTQEWGFQTLEEMQAHVASLADAR